MIKQYFLVLILTYIEYFVCWYFLEYDYNITWENIKFWLKYPPFICLFFFLIDSWIFATMIYTTFCFPYMLMLYCVKNVNRDLFGINRVIINNTHLHTPEKK